MNNKNNKHLEDFDARRAAQSLQLRYKIEFKIKCMLIHNKFK